MTPIVDRKWIVKEAGNPVLVRQLAQELGIDPVLSNLLVQRGIKSYEEAREAKPFEIYPALRARIEDWHLKERRTADGFELVDYTSDAYVALKDFGVEVAEEKKNFVEKMCSTIKKETGLDMSVPIWEVLARNQKVERLFLKCEFERDGKGEYSMCYEIDGKQHRLKFVGIGASIIEREFGHAFYNGNRSALIDEIGSLYGMPEEGRKVIKEFINMQEGLPSN